MSRSPRTLEAESQFCYQREIGVKITDNIDEEFRCCSKSSPTINLIAMIPLMPRVSSKGCQNSYHREKRFQ